MIMLSSRLARHWPGPCGQYQKEVNVLCLGTAWAAFVASTLIWDSSVRLQQSGPEIGSLANACRQMTLLLSPITTRRAAHTPEGSSCGEKLHYLMDVQSLSLPVTLFCHHQ